MQPVAQAVSLPVNEKWERRRRAKSLIVGEPLRLPVLWRLNQQSAERKLPSRSGLARILQTCFVGNLWNASFVETDCTLSRISSSKQSEPGSQKTVVRSDHDVGGNQYALSEGASVPAAEHRTTQIRRRLEAAVRGRERQAAITLPSGDRIHSALKTSHPTARFICASVPASVASARATCSSNISTSVKPSVTSPKSTSRPR